MFLLMLTKKRYLKKAQFETGLSNTRNTFNILIIYVFKTSNVLTRDIGLFVCLFYFSLFRFALVDNRSIIYSNNDWKKESTCQRVEFYS